MKAETIKWLQWHLDEINNNAVAMDISKEDTNKNEEIAKEIRKCIKWVKSKK